MAHVITSHASFAHAGSEGLLARLAARLAAYRRFHETRRELDGLSDRDLADLGIHRSNIGDIAAQAAWNL